jgi:hypothetical protein
MPEVIKDSPSAVLEAVVEQVNAIIVDMAAHTHGGVTTGTGTAGVTGSTLTAEAITLRT